MVLLLIATVPAYGNQISNCYDSGCHYPYKQGLHDKVTPVPIVSVIDSQIRTIDGSKPNLFGNLVRGALIDFEISIQNPGPNNISIENIVISKSETGGNNIISVPRVYSSETFSGTRNASVGSSWYTNTGTAVDSIIAFTPPYKIKAGETIHLSIVMDSSNTELKYGGTIQLMLTKMDWAVEIGSKLVPAQTNLYNQQGKLLALPYISNVLIEDSSRNELNHLKIGTKYWIRWSSLENAPVTIALERNGHYITNLIWNLEDNGDAIWTPDQSLQSGGNYQIVITEHKGGISGKSGNFTISRIC